MVLLCNNNIICHHNKTILIVFNRNLLHTLRIIIQKIRASKESYCNSKNERYGHSIIVVLFWADSRQ